jgi:hypothetical protein
MRMPSRRGGGTSIAPRPGSGTSKASSAIQSPAALSRSRSGGDAADLVMADENLVRVPDGGKAAGRRA